MITIKNQLDNLRVWVETRNRAVIRTYSFFKTLLLQPKTIGAISPSSKYLAKHIASCIPLPKNEWVVELGAGTGAITHAILEHGIPAEQLILIEASPDLATNVRKRFAHVNVIEGRAEDLMKLLENQSLPISTIVSSLPLRTLPADIKKKILLQIPKVIEASGRYIQFTYDLRKDVDFYPSNYHLVQSHIVWRNIPPAKVDVYTFN